MSRDTALYLLAGLLVGRALAPLVRALLDERRRGRYARRFKTISGKGKNYTQISR